jgi:nicotinamide-nucleotide amidase
MKAEIITIGDELLIGQVIDTNSAWLAHQLNLIGIFVYQITSISDDKMHIINALNEAISRVDLIMITGGLGPTNDDITKKTLAEYFQCDLVLNPDVLKDVESLLSSRGIKVIDLNRKQAEVPSRCTIIRNLCGTAPGMWFEEKDKVFISMPGVPFEMKDMT